jgi:hypothetical protein
MITITRRQARRLRGVFRRHVLGIAHRGTIPPLVLRAGGTQLRAQYRYATLAIEHVEPGIPRPDETLAVPLDALAEFEGRDDSPVVLEAYASDRVVVRWADHGVPQTREYAVPALDTLKPFPDSPADWTTLPSGFISILAEAWETASEDSTRYALNCLQLRGGTGEVAATDGRQLLICGGFSFPWADDLLVRRSPIFAGRALPRDQPVRIGRTDSHVVLGNGPWTLFLEIQIGVRFPALGHIVPDPAAAATRLSLDPEDARFLGEALGRLPGSEQFNAPATLELNGKIALRARGSDPAPVTELVLTRSRYSGTPVRVNTNREFLSRAVRLGFSEIEIVDAETPLVCRDRDLVFCWQPLAKDAAIEPSDDVVRIESTPTVTPTSVIMGVTTEARPTVSQTVETTSNVVQSHETTSGTAASANQDPAGLPALIQEAESLLQTLTDARARAGRLVVALRRHRRRERLVNSTLASLRALKLQDVAG